MKKMFLLLVSTCLFCACQKTMTITGTIDPAIDMDSVDVVLATVDGDSVLSTTTILNGSFTLKQPIKKAEIGRLIIYGMTPYDICLEEGNLAFTLTATEDESGTTLGNITCVGTPNNYIMNAYKQLESDTYAAFSAAGDDEAAKEEIFANYVDDVYEMIVANINTLGATYIFADNTYNFNIEQQGAIFAQLKPEFAEYGRIPRAKKAYDALVKTQEGCAYIDFALPTPAGDTLALSDLVGKTDYVLVDFWASWCGPCRRAMPALKEVYDANKGKLEILGVSLDREAESWTGAIDKLGLNWKHISDLKFWQCSAAELYGVSAIPATVLIDGEGVIVKRNPSEEEIISFLNTTK